MVGDQQDIVARLQRFLPGGWFPSRNADDNGKPYRIYAMVAGAATVLSTIYDQIAYARLQTRLASLTDIWADLAAYDFFGYTLRRRGKESDARLMLRVRREIFRERNTRAGVISVVQDLTQKSVTVFEPFNPQDAGGWDAALWGWDSGVGGWGDTDLPFQAFVSAARPAGGGVASVAGWDGFLGGWDAGAIEWVEPSMETVTVSDTDIYDAINSVRPAGVILWVNIHGNSSSVPSSELGKFVLGRSILQAGDSLNPSYVALPPPVFGGTTAPVKPAQIGNVQISNITTTGFTASWDADTTGTAPVFYNVYWGSQGSSSLLAAPNGTGLAVATFTISTGQPDTPYAIQIEGENAAGKGPRSVAVNVRTAATTTPQPPAADPSLTVPASLNAISGVATPIAGIKFVDSFSAGNGGTLALNLSCSGGTLSARDGNNVLVAGSGTASFSYNASFSNITAALSSLAFTGSAAGPLSVTVDIWDQRGSRFTKPISGTTTQGAGGSTGGTTGGGTTGGGTTGGGTTGGTTGGTGVPASRIADMMDKGGYNTFSDWMSGGNGWGSYPSIYTVDSVAAAIDFIHGNAGFEPQFREYHYNDKTQNQSVWCPQLASRTGGKFVMCYGTDVDVSQASGMLSLAAQSKASANPWLLRLEGNNEPNNFGIMNPNVVIDCQQALWGAGTGLQIFSPSIVIGLPFPEGYIFPPNGSNWMTQGQGATMGQKSNVISGHHYPSRNPAIDDAQGNPNSRNGELNDFLVGNRLLFSRPDLPVSTTEWHPSLYNTHGHIYDDALEAYLTALYYLESFIAGVHSWYWYALFDYGPGTRANPAVDQFGNPLAFYSGLFPRQGGVDPRPAAWTLRAMHVLTGDPNKAIKNTFTTSTFDYTIQGLPGPIDGNSPRTGGHHCLFENSAGGLFLYVWDSQDYPGGTSHPITITINSTPPRDVKHYNVSNGSASNTTPVQTIPPNPSSINFSLDASVRLFVITR